jgi:hypothetical protein
MEGGYFRVLEHKSRLVSISSITSFEGGVELHSHHIMSGGHFWGLEYTSRLVSHYCSNFFWNSHWDCHRLQQAYIFIFVQDDHRASQLLQNNPKERECSVRNGQALTLLEQLQHNRNRWGYATDLLVYWACHWP